MSILPIPRGVYPSVDRISPEKLARRGIRLVLADLDNTLVPSSQEETEETMRGLITLLEKGTENPSGSLNFLLTL